MHTVQEVLAHKRTQELFTIGPDEMVFEALRIFANQDLGALLVTDHGKLLGLITERDYARRLALKGLSDKTTPVRDIMARHLIYVSPGTTIEHCMALMLNRFTRHLPVLDGSSLVGIVSIGDVVKALLGEKSFLIDELVHYIIDSPLVMHEHPGSEGVAAASYTPKSNNYEGSSGVSV